MNNVACRSRKRGLDFEECAVANGRFPNRPIGAARRLEEGKWRVQDLLLRREGRKQADIRSAILKASYLLKLYALYFENIFYGMHHAMYFKYIIMLYVML